MPSIAVIGLITTNLVNNIDIPVEVIPRREAPATSAHVQDNLASRYPTWVGWMVMAAFLLAFAGWLNETWFFLFDSPIWLNRYTEYAIILGFGLWRIRAEKNTYTRRRLVILVSVVTVLWWLIPWLWPFFEPYVGFQWSQPVFPAIHAPGTLTFFLILTLVLLFGRRIVCGFGCPCVGVRETVGFAFRHKTLRGDWANRLRHIKWLFFIWYMGVLVVTLFPPTGWTTSFVGLFGLTVALTYFGSFFLVPLTGNRFYCRSLCPFGATFGILNHAGLYDLRLDPERCIDCARCEQACDMGIPVMREGKASGGIHRIEDCMGCARCVVSCPTDALEIRDVRNLLQPRLRLDASHLLNSSTHLTIPERQSTGEREVLNLQQIMQQASRCIDCGEPGCRQGCPLNNRIPEWLMLAREGNIHQAADLINDTSTLPEFCGQLCPQQRLCEGACTRQREGRGAVAIGAIEHSIMQHAFDSGWIPSSASTRNGLKAVTIGSGPASLAFADFMNRAGWQVTVHEQAESIGGMLHSGLPGFRFDKSALDRRLSILRNQGIRFELNQAVDEARFESLYRDNDVLFLGIGARSSKTINLPGDTLNGVIDALTFLNACNQGDHSLLENAPHVLVIGGGDSAMDCARTASRGGAASVTLCYRGPREQLRASPEEVILSEQDGVKLLFQQRPVAIGGTHQVNQVSFEVVDDISILKCDLLILAIGQQGSAPDWLLLRGITVEQGIISTDRQGRTAVTGIYAGGDCAHGPDLISAAIAAGRQAALAAQTDHKAGVRRLPSTAVRLADGSLQLTPP